jgi:quinoprotein glucose dehydrogenase
MSSIVPAGAATASPASQAPRRRAWSAALLGVPVALMGLILAGGGAWLAALGGSWYYVLAGAMFLASGVLMIRRRMAGFYTYAGAYAFTAVWTFWEIGLSGWELIPRLVAPSVFLVLAILVTPALDPVAGRRARKLGAIGAGLFAAALAVLIPIVNRQSAPQSLPDVQADAPFRDPAYTPGKGEWNAYGGGRAPSGIPTSPRSRPTTSRT